MTLNTGHGNETVGSVSSTNLIHLLSYSGLTLNQDKATKPQTLQIVRQGEATPYWFKFNPLYRSFQRG